MSPSFWNGKKVFITGHTGFKGGWLSLWLISLGAKVTGYALAPCSTPSFFELANLKKMLVNIEGDIRDFDQLSKALYESQPQFIFHLAAQSLVAQSYDEPLETYKTNVMGTVNLLECVRKMKNPCSLVNVTSDKCYENKEWHWGYREIDALGGFDPYSNSKACSEFVSESYRSSFFNESEFQNHKVALATARAGNVVGGGDWAKNRLVPDVLKALENSRAVQLRHPGSVRPWQHVLEPLYGYLLLAEKLDRAGPQFAKAWNFGPNKNDIHSVADLVKKLCEMWGSPQTWNVQVSEFSHEAIYLSLDTSLAQKELGWKPLMNTYKALQLTVEWEKLRLSGVDVLETSLQQISNYQKLILN